MAAKIKITPAELQAQAAEMQSLESAFSTLSSGVSSDLKDVNANWSANLSHNFEKKINNAQKSFMQITQELMNGAKVADTCAVTFHTIDQELSKLYCTDTGTPIQSTNSLLEEAQTAGAVFGWAEDQWDALPKWITSGVENFWEFLIPADNKQLKKDLKTLKDAYGITSDILQGEFDLKAGWKAVSSILKKNTKLAIICETINYTYETGIKRTEEMEKQVFDQLGEGDILGAAVDMAEGFVDTIIAGSVEVLGDVGGGLLDKAIDKVPVVNGINKATKYLTGLFGANEGEGYSVGGMVAEGAELIGKGVDAVTDVISDTADVVTDALTDGTKATINWVKSWFD